MKKFIVLFGLCYKLIYLCSAIRMKCAKSDLAAGRVEEVRVSFYNNF